MALRENAEYRISGNSWLRVLLVALKLLVGRVLGEVVGRMAGDKWLRQTAELGDG
jgi:hypothetical protein